MKKLNLGLAIISLIVTLLVMATEVRAQGRTDLPPQVGGQTGTTVDQRSLNMQAGVQTFGANNTGFLADPMMQTQSPGQFQCQGIGCTAANYGNQPFLGNPNGQGAGIAIGGCFPMPQTQQYPYNPYSQNYPGYNPYYQNLYYPYSSAPYYSQHNLYYDYNYYHPYYSNLLWQDPGYASFQNQTFGGTQYGGAYYGQQNMMNGNFGGVYDQTRSYYGVQRDSNNNAYYVPNAGSQVQGVTPSAGSSISTTNANGTGASVIQ